MASFSSLPLPTELPWGAARDRLNNLNRVLDKAIDALARASVLQRRPGFGL